MKISRLIVALTIPVMLIAMTSCPTPDGPPQTETVATPTANPPGGIYTEAQTVTLETTTPGASIYYTLNGTTPSASSTLYTSSITISDTTTLKAIAVKNGMNNSDILEAVYTINLYPDTAAIPTANPPGGTYNTAQTVTLSTTTDGASIYYTISGSTPDTIYNNSPLPIPYSLTIKAIAVKDGMNNSKVMTETYTIDSGTETPIALSLGGVEAQLTASTGVISMNNYADPPAIGAFAITDTAIKSAVNGTAITVQLTADGAADISLAYVHYLRKSLLEAGALSVSIADNGNFTPVFSGFDWWSTNGYPSDRNLYDSYTLSETQIINGIMIVKDTFGKYVMVYDRNLKIKDVIVNQAAPLHGTGLRKGTGNILPYNEWGSVIIHAGYFYGTGTASSFDDFVIYKEFMEEAGLYPSASNDIRPMNNVKITSAGSNTNVMANGIYDFILAYYNPDKDGGGQDLRDSLPVWPSGLTFDGGDNGGVSTRTIGGVPSGNPYRKGTDGVSGMPNEDFVGSITVPMANYMKDVLKISEFKNTNIIGDVNKWTDGNDVSIGGSNIRLIPTTNISLIGDYSSLYGLVTQETGVLDIKGSLPQRIMLFSGTGMYLNIWQDVLRETNILDFPVVTVRGTGGNLITTGSPLAPNCEAKVIIYYNKYTGTPNATLKPHHRAFISDGIPKITGSDITSNAAYLGSDSNKLIPELDESKWIKAANGEIATPPNLAASYADLPASWKMTQAEFDSLP
jgi:hypothetical protein